MSTPEETEGRDAAVRVAAEWLRAVNAGDDATAVQLSAFTAGQLQLVRRSLAGAETWTATTYRQEYAPGIEQLTFIDAVSGRSGKLLVQLSDEAWKVIALVETDGTTFPRAPARVMPKSTRGMRLKRTT